MLVLGMVKVKDYGLFRPNADSGKRDTANAKKSRDFVAKAGLFPYNSGPRNDWALYSLQIYHSLPSILVKQRVCAGQKNRVF